MGQRIFGPRVQAVRRNEENALVRRAQPRVELREIGAGKATGGAGLPVRARIATEVGAGVEGAMASETSLVDGPADAAGAEEGMAVVVAVDEAASTAATSSSSQRRNLVSLRF